MGETEQRGVETPSPVGGEDASELVARLECGDDAVGGQGHCP